NPIPGRRSSFLIGTRPRGERGDPRHNDNSSQTPPIHLPQAPSPTGLLLRLQVKSRCHDYSSSTNHPVTFLVLEEGPDVTRALSARQPRGRRPSCDANDIGRSPTTPTSTPYIWGREPIFPHPRAIAGMLQAIIPYIPQLTQRSSAQPQATPPTQAGAILPPERHLVAIQPVDDLPQFPGVSERVPSGDTTRHPTPTPSTSIRSLPNPDTLSSDSTDSLRAQLHLVNQRIDDVYKTIKMKDEWGEGSLYATHKIFTSRRWRHMTNAPTQQSTSSYSKRRWLCIALMMP
ncbi:hypothetical protein BHE74_00024937, partial [Ensete ventricosum]